MLITKNVTVKISNANVKYYTNLLYEVDSGDEINIDVNLLSNGSHQIVIVKCDECGTEKPMKYKEYKKKYELKYLCRKCAEIKRKENFLLKYGCEYPAQKKEFYDKQIKTLIENYGVNNPSKNNDIQNKKKITNNEKFGVDWCISNKNIQNKSKETCIKKYGVDNIAKLDEIKEKVKKTSISKYGVTNYSKTKEYIKKSKETCIKKYGVDSFSKTMEFRDRISKKMFEKYGVEHALQNEDIFYLMQKNSYKIKMFDDIYYQGTYEKDFLDKYYKKYKINRGKTINYIFNGKKAKYFSDFYLKNFNLIIEIKSTIWYNKHKEMCLEKQKACVEQNFNYIIIFDKNYSNFEKIIKKIKLNRIIHSI